MRVLFNRNELNQVTNQWEKSYTSEIAKRGGKVTRLNAPLTASSTHSFIYHVTMPDRAPRIDDVKFGPKRMEKLGKVVDGWIVKD
ncbi:hypothetical protein AWENTII_011895 [Aspergillus wentii]|nr:hypothetical protein MW887_008354 [Aspergillus wentii]